MEVNIGITEVRAPLPDIVNDTGSFKFPNGDSYTGGYEARKLNYIIVKQGFGVYTTWDGHTYTGFWVNDQLDPSEEVSIEFCDTSKYCGVIKDSMFSGCGIYTFPDKNYLQCSFTENMPNDEIIITFIDKQGFTWVGGAVGKMVKLKSLNKFYTTCRKKYIPIALEEFELIADE